MSLWKIAWRSIQQRALASTMTGLSMALGVALVVTVLVINGAIKASYSKSAQGFDLIVGKGGQLELVLNTLYHLGTSAGTLPWTYYEEFKNEPTSDGRPKGKYATSVTVAIPYCVGDNFEGYRVVGTVPGLFDLEYVPGKERYAFSQGRNFKQESFFEAVIGSVVASRTGLRVGDEFAPTHGVREDRLGHKHEPFKVVGVLAPTGTPNDRALFVNIEGFFLLEGHAAEKKPGSSDRDNNHEAKSGPEPREAHVDHGDDRHEPLPKDLRALSAILVRNSNPMVSRWLPRSINDDQIASAVFPTREVTRLQTEIIGNIELILLVLATLVVVVAGVGIMVSIYNSMSERRREIAVMRSLGAQRGTVLSIILLESMLLSLGGGVAGFLLGHLLIGTLSPLIASYTGVVIGFFQFPTFTLRLREGGIVVGVPYELILLPGLVILATLVGYLPALTAYRTDVAKALSASP